MTDQERIDDLERRIKELEKEKEGPDWKKALEDIAKAIPPSPPVFIPVPYHPPYYHPYWPAQPYWITYTSGTNTITVDNAQPGKWYPAL